MPEYHDEDDLTQDFEVEITDLDRREASTRPRWFTFSRLTLRQRRASLALTAGLFLLTCLFLLSSISDVRGLLLRTFASPSQDTAIGGLRLYLVSNPAWGQFQLDGVTLTHLPLAEHDAPLVLAIGSHQLSWHAEPFQARQCTLIVENNLTPGGSCTRNDEVSLSYLDNSAVLLIAFFASLRDLPASQHAELIQQIHTALAVYTSSEIVYPGEVYAVSRQEAISHPPAQCPKVASFSLCYAQARQTLLATLEIQEDMQTSANDPCVLTEVCYFYHLDCRLLCPDMAVALSGIAVEGWNVLAAVHLLWNYATLAGTMLASAQPDTALSGVPDYQLFALHISRNGQSWQVAPFGSPVISGYTDPVCGQAMQDTMELVNTFTTNNQSVGIKLWSDQHTHLAAGCLEAASPAPGVFATPTPIPTPNPNLTPTPPTSVAQDPGTAYCLFRFGVVLAANTVAHQLWPYLPQADAYEQGIAQRLYSLLPA